jgi:hypothetical protein
VSIKDEVYRFRVDERFRGVSGKFIDVMAILTEDGPAGFSGVGRQYLVNARAFPYLPGHPPVMMGCGSDMYVLPWAQAVVDQIRRERRGLPVATVYGSLIRTMAGRDETFDSGYLRSLPGIAVRLQSGERTFETTTTANGTYAFQRLPPGTYRISARLPASLKAVDHNLEEPPDRVKVEPGSCYRVNVPVIPTTKISGRVVGPDGQARRNTHVSVFRADRYTDGVEGTQARQNDGRPFEFSGLAPGDYVLVFGNDSSKDGIDPDNAFPETFYPAAPDRRRSTVIHLAEGQQILNADIYLPAALPTRRLMVTVRWRGPRPPDYLNARIVVQVEGRPPTPKVSVFDDTYWLNLLADRMYQLRAETYCASGAATTNTVAVDGRDTSTRRVTLTFPSGVCAAMGPM